MSRLHDPAVPVVVASGTTNATPRTEHSILYGLFAEESAGTPAAAGFSVFSGTSNAGDLILKVDLTGDEFKQIDLPFPGVACEGIFIERTSGTTTITLYCEDD